MLFPLGVEDGRTNAKPFVTYGIIVACVSVWIISISTANEVDAAFERAIRLWIERPYVVPPADLEVRLPPNVVVMFEQAGAKMNPGPQEIYEGQKALDEITAEVVAAEPQSFSHKWGLVPSRGLNQIGWISNIFIHFGLGHLFFNLLFFWVVARALEDHWGHLKFFAFFIAAGVFATGCHFALDPESQRVLGGASGAIAGCLGAFAFAFPAKRVRMILFLIVIWKRFWVPGWIWSAFWFVGELRGISDEVSGGSTAVMAHIGGWLFGFAAAAVATFFGTRDVASKIPALAVAGMVVLLGGSIAVFALPFRGDDRQPGSVMITSTPPGAAIYIDGALAPQKTPYTLDGIRLGRAKHIAVAMAGHRSRPAEAFIVPAPGNTVKRATFDLTPVAEVEIRSTPAGARVVLDGRAVGVTPIRLPAMDVGREIAVQVVKDDHIPVVETFRILAGSSPREVALLPSRRITIESEPTGAKVEIDSRDVGTTPADIDVPRLRTFRLSVNKAGFSGVRRKVRPGSRKRLTVKLKPLELSALPLDAHEKKRLVVLREDLKRLDREVARQKRQLGALTRNNTTSRSGTIYDRLGTSNRSQDVAAELENLAAQRASLVDDIESLRAAAIDRLSQ